MHPNLRLLSLKVLNNRKGCKCSELGRMFEEQLLKKVGYKKRKAHKIRELFCSLVGLYIHEQYRFLFEE